MNSFTRPVAVLLVLFAIAVAGCMRGEPKERHVHGVQLLVISQSTMNMLMLKRVIDAGASACNSDSGLQGVTWPYNTTPRGPLIRERDASLVPDTPGPRESERVSQRMQNLAAAAPRPYVTTAPPNYEGVGLHAMYICRDAAEKSGQIYLFVP
jgi:hypothetical protein